MPDRLHNVNVLSSELLPTPEQIKRELPLPPASEEFVYRSRGVVRRILDGEDPRLFVVVGPCSIHDPTAAREYATRLRGLAKRVEDTMLLLMRVYFEKPRTTIGWKGLINDPDMDDSFHIEKGIRLARELLLFLADIGLPAATEALDPIMPQYLSELVTWTAIGARTTESQTHREMASCSLPAIRTTSSASRSRASRPYSAPAATATDTSCCAVAAAARTTTRSASPPASENSSRRACPRASWWIAATAIRTRIRDCSRRSRRTSRTRSCKATARWSG
jgi:hypothetical protein